MTTMISAILEWDALRVSMIRQCPEPFSRAEWAYLISFLDAENLVRFRASALDGWPAELAPTLRGDVALWLPNNVSLLGPLMLVALSLTGVRVRAKAGSRGEDLSTAFVHYLRHTLPPGTLSTWFNQAVDLQVFDAADPRNAEMAAGAAVRIVFGSDAAADAINALPSPADSHQISFTHRVSEAWAFARPSSAELDTLIQVLAIYGQAGCTSPSRLLLLDAGPEAADALAADLAARWARRVPTPPAPHIASNTLMASQWAQANGWRVQRAAANGALFAAGDFSLTPFRCEMGLPILATTAAEAQAQVPANAQTLGWLGAPPQGVRGFLRVVPLAEMHHFAPVWDGHVFLRELYHGVPSP